MANIGPAGPGFFAIGDATPGFDPVASQGLFNALASPDSAAQAMERYFNGTAGEKKHHCETCAAVARVADERFWRRRSVAAAYATQQQSGCR